MIYTGAKHSQRLKPLDQLGIQGDLRGKPAPDFELSTLDGKKVKLSDLRGMVVLGISVDEGSSEKIASFAKEMGVTYTVLRTTDEVSNLYGGIDGLPTVFYVGRDGVVVEQAAGLV